MTVEGVWKNLLGETEWIMGRKKRREEVFLLSSFPSTLVLRYRYIVLIGCLLVLDVLSDKAFSRGSSFCSLGQSFLQKDDPLDFLSLYPDKAFKRKEYFDRPKIKSSVFDLRSSASLLSSRFEDIRFRMIIVHEVILPHLMKTCSMKFLLILCSAVINTIITIMSKHRRTMLGNV